MTRESIPRFDLYGELGIGRDATADEIESAYRVRLGERPATGTGALASRRKERLARAREWLLDPERRARYDAAPDRTVAAAAAAAWPAADLERAEAAAGMPDPEPDRPTPRAAVFGADRPRSGPRLSFPAVLALTVIVSVMVVGGIVLALTGSDGTANATPTPPPATTAPTEVAQATAEPTVAPTIEPTVGPTEPGPTGFPVAEFQQHAWDALRALKTAAAAGDVAAAQAILGESAPGLRPSGLRAATFPDIQPGDLSVAAEGALYTASWSANGTPGVDMSSPDGITWTIEYADRPLAVYRSAGTAHDLWWQESDGQHHLFLQMTSATITKSGVVAHISWTFDPSRPDDATDFKNASAVLLPFAPPEGGPDTNGGLEATGLAGRTSLDLPAVTVDTLATTPKLSLWVVVLNPRKVGGPDRAVDTEFVLPLR